MKQEPTYLVELPDGSFLNVPESKLESVSNLTQEDLDKPLSKAEQLLADKLLERILGRRG